MLKNNSQILTAVRDTMRLMLRSAESHNWHRVTLLDKERTGLLASLSTTEYTGDIELIDEIVKLDEEIIATATKAKSDISEKVTRASRTKDAHQEYNSIAKL